MRAGEVRELRAPFQFDEPLDRQVWFEPGWQNPPQGREEPPQAAPSERGYDQEVRIDAINWSDKLQVWKRGFFVLWEGSFEVPEDGWYIFRLKGNGRKSLVVNDDHPAQLMSIFDTGDREVTLPLETGKRHHIRVTYQHYRLVQPSVQLSMAQAPALENLAPSYKQMRR